MKNRPLISSCVGLSMALAAIAAPPTPSPRVEGRAPGAPSLFAEDRGEKGELPAKKAKAPAAPGASSLFAEDKTDKAESPAKKAKGPTEIVALEATFDQKTHMAIFTGDVVVTDPEFNVQSDKLTAYLKHEDKPAEPSPGRLKLPVDPTAPPPKKSSGLEKAIAEANPGNVVTVTQDKKELDGTLNHSVGHGKKVVFDSVTGDITLTGRPDVQQGLNTCVSSDESTVMILNRDGHMRVTGPHKTIIKDQGDLAK